MRHDTHDDAARIVAAMSDDDKQSLITLIERRDDLLRAAANGVAEIVAVKDRVAGELRARRGARLADPDAALWRGLYGELQPRGTRKRKPTLAGVARQAAKAGIEVARYEVRPDGSVAVVPGKPAAASVNDNDTSIDRSEFN